MTTLAPAATRERAVAAPRPEPAPVTINVLLPICMDTFLSVSGCLSNSLRLFHDNYRHVVFTSPLLPVDGALLPESCPVFLNRAGPQRPLQALLEMRLQRRYCHPAVTRLIDVVFGNPPAKDRPRRGGTVPQGF